MAVQIILGFDDKTPPRPDTSRSRQCKVLSQGEFLGGAEEVADAGKDDCPFHYGGPTHHPLVLVARPICEERYMCKLTRKENYELADQKCTVFSPTSLVHSRWNTPCF